MFAVTLPSAHHPFPVDVVNDWLDYATAASTAAAAIIALLIALLPAIRARLSRPHLHVELGLSTPFLRISSTSDALHVRLRVTNTGRSTATAVRAWIVGYWELIDETWRHYPVDALEIAWATKSQQGLIVSTDIPKQMQQFLDLCHIDTRTGTVFFPNKESIANHDCEATRFDVVLTSKERGKTRVVAEVKTDKKKPFLRGAQLTKLPNPTVESEDQRLVSENYIPTPS
jgi:hypothetical protein